MNAGYSRPSWMRNRGTLKRRILTSRMDEKPGDPHESGPRAERASIHNAGATPSQQTRRLTHSEVWIECVREGVTGDFLPLPI